MKSACVGVLSIITSYMFWCLLHQKTYSFREIMVSLKMVKRISKRVGGNW